MDGLLHNAGILGPRVPLEHVEPSAWQEVIHVNLTSEFLMTKALLPLLQRSDDASIVFTSSGVGQRGRAYWGPYAVSKFGVEGLMQVWADELENTSHIRCNSLDPGGTRTSMRAQAYPAEDPLSLPIADEHMNLYLYLMGPIQKASRDNASKRGTGRRETQPEEIVPGTIFTSDLSSTRDKARARSCDGPSMAVAGPPRLVRKAAQGGRAISPLPH